MRFPSQPVSPLPSPAEEAGRPKPGLPAHANRVAAHAPPQPAPAEARSRGTQTAHLSAREARWAQPKRQAERQAPASLPVNRSLACVPQEPSRQPALDSRSRRSEERRVGEEG